MGGGARVNSETQTQQNQKTNKLINELVGDANTPPPTESTAPSPQTIFRIDGPNSKLEIRIKKSKTRTPKFKREKTLYKHGAFQHTHAQPPVTKRARLDAEAVQEQAHWAPQARGEDAEPAGPAAAERGDPVGWRMGYCSGCHTMAPPPGANGRGALAQLAADDAQKTRIWDIISSGRHGVTCKT